MQSLNPYLHYCVPKHASHRRGAETLMRHMRRSWAGPTDSPLGSKLYEESNAKHIRLRLSPTEEGEERMRLQVLLRGLVRLDWKFAIRPVSVMIPEDVCSEVVEEIPAWSKYQVLSMAVHRRHEEWKIMATRLEMSLMEGVHCPDPGMHALEIERRLENVRTAFLTILTSTAPPTP